MSRPELGPLIPSSGVDAVGRRGSINNPMLDPIRAATYDAALEWYFSNGSLASVAYFRKDISTYIQSITSLIPFNQLGLPDSLLANSNTQPDELFTINRLANTPGGTLEGLEFNVQTPFRFLPGFLSNFGMLSSVTLTRSSITYILDTGNLNRPLIGMSTRSISGTLYYEDKKFSARVTGNYRSDFIRSIPSGAPYSDYIGNKPTFFMDFSASYQLTPQVRVLLEAQNLTKESNVQFMDSQRQDSLFALNNGRTVTLGVNFKL
jgi:TonB-dependent receptor